MSFFGMTLKLGDIYTQVIPQLTTLRLTNVILSPLSPVKNGSLFFQNEDNKKFVLCHFNEGTCQFHGLNLLFRPKETVSLGVEGNIIVCVSGYYMQNFDPEFDDSFAMDDLDDDGNHIDALNERNAQKSSLLPSPSSKTTADTPNSNKKKKKSNSGTNKTTQDAVNLSVDGSVNEKEKNAMVEENTKNFSNGKIEKAGKTELMNDKKKKKKGVSGERKTPDVEKKSDGNKKKQNEGEKLKEKNDVEKKSSEKSSGKGVIGDSDDDSDDDDGDDDDDDDDDSVVGGGNDVVVFDKGNDESGDDDDDDDDDDDGKK